MSFSEYIKDLKGFLFTDTIKIIKFKELQNKNLRTPLSNNNRLTNLN